MRTRGSHDMSFSPRTSSRLRPLLAAALLAACPTAAPAQQVLPVHFQDPGLLLPPAPRAGENGASELSDLRYVGAGSCAASNCHGNPDTRRVRGSEYTIWSLDDAHARAFTVLYNERSQTIARNLGLEAAHTAQVCLNCHALETATAGIEPGVAGAEALGSPSALLHSAAHILADGVSCETCHGPAGAWLEPHRRAEWQNPAIWPPERKQAAGFREMTDVLARTEACAACHVGGPGRDVNHDLIAAGHPRLYFEMAAYHSRMPAHWSRRKDFDRHGPALEAKLWAVGQAVSAEAAARLLAHRAGDERAPWPEFAEYSCFACHHALDTPSWRQDPQRVAGAERSGAPGALGLLGASAPATRRAGTLPWGNWHFAEIPLLGGHPATPAARQITADRQAVRLAMAAFPRTPRRQVATPATALADRLSDWAVRLNEADYSGPAAETLTRELAAWRELPPGDWDAAAQLYLAVVAANQARMRSLGAPLVPPLSEDEAVYAELRRIRDLLAFPRVETAAQVDSPREFGPEATREMLERLERIERLLAGP